MHERYLFVQSLDRLLFSCYGNSDILISAHFSTPFSNGLLQSRGGETMLGGDPHQPEWGRNVLLNSYQHDTQQYTAGVPIHNDSMKSVDSISRHWSDPTLTGSGRCSVYSWGLYEAVRYIYLHFPIVKSHMHI